MEGRPLNCEFNLDDSCEVGAFGLREKIPMTRELRIWPEIMLLRHCKKSLEV